MGNTAPKVKSLTAGRDVGSTSRCPLLLAHEMSPLGCLDKTREFFFLRVFGDVVGCVEAEKMGSVGDADGLIEMFVNHDTAFGK